jgi:Xaa-Pro dipeptidase
LKHADAGAMLWRSRIIKRQRAALIMSALLAALFDDHIRIQRERTDAALAFCKLEMLAIFAGRAPMQFLDDQPYPFRANPHFKLWAPLADSADCWIIYRPGAPLRLIFLQPIDYWYKPPALPADYWTKHFAIEVARDPKDALALLKGLKHCAFVGEWQPEFADCGFASTNPAQLIDRLHYSRARKTSYELECLRRASVKGARGHVTAEAAFRAGESEYDIHMEYVRATRHTEIELPYHNIIALNQNAAVLHYQHRELQPPPDRRSFLIDAGAEFGGYACDITRTYSQAKDEFAELIDKMHALQSKLCAKVQANVDYANIHLDAHGAIANVLKEHKIIRIDAEDAVASGLSSVFFPHGVGHLLGLQVHDVAGFAVSIDGAQKARPAGHPYLRLTRTLEPGFVVTIEPGLYFIEALLNEARSSKHSANIDWQRVEEFKPYGGIRIEDDVACTHGAAENLTRAAFASIGA